jgi:hypothetical protein
MERSSSEFQRNGCQLMCAVPYDTKATSEIKVKYATELLSLKYNFFYVNQFLK